MDLGKKKRKEVSKIGTLSIHFHIKHARILSYTRTRTYAHTHTHTHTHACIWVYIHSRIGWHMQAVPSTIFLNWFSFSCSLLKPFWTHTHTHLQTQTPSPALILKPNSFPLSPLHHSHHHSPSPKTSDATSSSKAEKIGEIPQLLFFIKRVKLSLQHVAPFSLSFGLKSFSELASV